MVSATRKWKAEIPSNGDELYEVVDGKQLAENGGRKILHTQGFRYILFHNQTKEKSKADLPIHTL